MIVNKNINEHIALLPENVGKMVQSIRKLVHDVAPEAVECIKYGIPTFTLSNKNLVHFAGYKNHVGFYPAPAGIDAFKKELAPYRSGKGTVQFPLDKPLPLGLIKKIVLYRVKQTSHLICARSTT
jgi:uncharacterized protein YdhG (YjbR/CyaY superfamily)